MTASQLLIAHAVKLLILAAVAGILFRRRSHLCWSFVSYLVVILTCNGLVSFWPQTFFKPWMWILQHGLYDALKMGIALELGYRTFQAFPGALHTARKVVFAVLVVTSAAIVGIPTASGTVTFGVVLLEWQPRVLTGTIWLMTGLATLVTWYRVPIHAWHKALLLGFVPYLLVFTTALNVLRSWGWGMLQYVQTLEPLAYLALVGFWAWQAWKPEAEPDVSPEIVRRLQPWRKAA